MKVPIKMHLDLATNSATYEYAEVPDKTVTDIFQRLYVEHLEKKGETFHGKSRFS